MPGLLAPSAAGSTSPLAAAASAEEPLAGGTACRLLFGTTEVAARACACSTATRWNPGRDGARRSCTSPKPSPCRLASRSSCASIRPPTTVAGGRILDPASSRRRRHDPRVLGRPRRAWRRGAGRCARASASGRWVRPARPCANLARARRHGAGPGAAAACRSSGAREIGDRFVGAAGLRRLCAPPRWRRSRSTTATIRWSTASPVERLTRRWRSPSRWSPRSCATWSASRGTVASGRRPLAPRRFRSGPQRERGRPPAGGSCSAGPASTPPDEAEAVGRDVRRREALTYLVGAGTVIRAVDRVQRRAVLFHRDGGGRGARTRLRDLPRSDRTPEAGLPRPRGRRGAGISRKFSIPLLEHLDATGFTRRAGDRRVIVELEPGAAQKP